jgi:hypothetical protein
VCRLNVWESNVSWENVYWQNVCLLEVCLPNGCCQKNTWSEEKCIFKFCKNVQIAVIYSFNLKFFAQNTGSNNYLIPVSGFNLLAQITAKKLSNF